MEKEQKLIGVQTCDLREKAYMQHPYTPKGDISTITKGTYYLVEVDDMLKRKYEIKA